MTVAGMGLVLCAAAALEIEEEEKKKEKRREEEARGRVRLKRKKSEGLVENKSPAGPQQDFAIRTGGRRIASFKNYLRMDPDTFIKILERITPGIKKLTTNFKKNIPACLRLAATLRLLATGNSSKCISYSFRVCHNIACEFFIEVCQAIIDEYANEVIVTPTKKF